MIDRRGVTFGLTALAAWPAGAATPAFSHALAEIEARVRGRLGVALLETGTGRLEGRRLDERFPLCSTFKMLGAAAVLRNVDAGRDRLDRRIRYAARDLVPYSPVTEKHVEDGMTMAAICDAAVTRSDNTAGNLILASLGGPGGITALARSLGDRVTRLDRTEPTLNEATPGDLRDTTSPAAMAGTVRALALGTALSPRSRDRFAAWLRANQTGGKRLRAGLPAGWIVGDKTGSGDRGTTNDVAVVWPPRRAPIVIAVYLTQTEAPVAAREAAIADVGRAVAARLRG